MITPAGLASELVIAKRILTEYTNLYCNSISLSFANEDRIQQNCIELLAAYKSLESIVLIGTDYYLGGVIIDEDYYLRILSIIHEYDDLGIIESTEISISNALTKGTLQYYVPVDGSTGIGSVVIIGASALDLGIREGKFSNMPIGTYRINFSVPFLDSSFNNHVQIIQDGYDVFNEFIEPTSDPADLVSFPVTVPSGGLATIYYSAIKFQ
jgi:hypothetical protein